MDVLMLFSTIVVALITAVFGPIAVEWAKNYFTFNVPGKSPIHEAIEINSLVDEQLHHIVEELKCDRAWIAQFHNGGYFYPTGKSIQKFSIFYEVCATNVISVQSHFQNVPVSVFPKAMSVIYDEGELSIPTYEDGVETYGLEGVSRPYNTQSFYIIGLYSLDDHLIGVIAIAYNTQHDLNKEEWIFIRQKVGVIGTLLTNYLGKYQK